MYKLLNNAVFGETMDNIRNRVKVEFIKRNHIEKIIKQQSKLSFNGIHKSYTNYCSYTFKQNEELMNQPIYLGFPVLELSKLLMYEAIYDKLQTCFGDKNIKLYYMENDSFILNVITKAIIENLKKLDDLFDFSNLSENLYLFFNKKNKEFGKFKVETPKNV